MTDTLTAPEPDEIEIALDDGAEPGPKPTGAPAEQPKPKSASTEDGIDELRAKLAASEQARQADSAARAEAERRATAAVQQAARAQAGQQDSETQTVETGIAQVKQAIEVYEGQLESLWAAGDFRNAAKVQAELARAAARQQALETGLEQMKARPKPAPATIDDPVELAARQVAQSGSPRSAQWVRAHPQYITDPNLNRRLIGAHNVAESEGIAMDSDAYFARVEGILGMRGGAANGGGHGAANGVGDGNDGFENGGARRQSPPAAPVSRGPNGSGSAPRTVRLTSEQREMAKNLFPDLPEDKALVEYARNMMLLKAEGRLQ